MTIRDLIPWGRQETRAPSMFRDDSRDPMLSLRREMDRLFDDVFRSGMPGLFGGMSRWPSVELSEHDNAVRITAELPGLSEQDVELSLDEDVLTIRGERKAESEDKDRGYSERFYGRFERQIALPAGVDADKASASFANGVLSITLPRQPGTERRRRIPINAETKH